MSRENVDARLDEITRSEEVLGYEEAENDEVTWRSCAPGG